MRLTLRTLLAYLDDTLDPAQAKAIGQKVAESEQAQELIARIKQVTRRRRLTTPPDTGPGGKDDPNTVAAYLDNALPGEQLAEVEETCLASDVHLAEIAACHQILTLVLGEPAFVPPTARQRMYRLVKGPEAIPFRRPPAAEAAPAEAPDEGQEVDETLRLGLPAYTRGGRQQRGVILGVGLVLVALLAFAVWQVLPGAPRSAAERESTGPDLARTTVPENNAGPRPKPKGEQGAAGRQTNRDQKRIPRPVKDRIASATDGGARPATDRAVVNKDGGVKPDTDRSRPDRTGAGESAADRPPRPVTNPQVVARYLAPGPRERPSILVRREGDRDQWQRLERARPDVSTGDTLVSMPGYRSEIGFKNGLRLELAGDLPELSGYALQLESTVILHDPGDVDLDLTLDHGRIILTNEKAKGPARVVARFENPTTRSGQDAWEVNLTEPGSSVSLDLWGRYPADIPFNPDPKTRLGPQSMLFLVVLKGRAEVRINNSRWGMEAPPSGPSLVSWDSTEGAKRPQQIKRLPDWVTGRFPDLPKDFPKQLKDELERRRSRMLRAMDEVAISMAGKGLQVALEEQLRQTDPLKRSLVVRCFGAVNDLDKVLDGLVDEDSADVRQAAVETLRHWIGLHKDNDLVLYQFLIKNKGYTPKLAGNIMRLLHSFSDQERADPGTYALLIDMLRQKNQAIRVLAHWHLCRLVPEGAPPRIAYDPMGRSDERERGADQWKRLIPEGSLPPAPAGAPPKDGKDAKKKTRPKQ